MTWWSRLRPWGSWMSIKVSLPLPSPGCARVLQGGAGPAHCVWDLQELSGWQRVEVGGSMELHGMCMCGRTTPGHVHRILPLFIKWHSEARVIKGNLGQTDKFQVHRTEII